MDTQTAESLLNFSEESSLGFQGLESRSVFAELERRYADLLAAMQWFIDQERTDEALRLATSLPLFWMATKRLDEGSAWFERAQGLPGGDNINRGEALFQAGLLAFWKGDDDRASALHNQALAIGRQAGDPTSWQKP